MRESGLPHPQFQVVTTETNLREAITEFGLPCLAKTTFGGYDGKGQFLLQSDSDVDNLVKRVSSEPQELILEEKIILDQEVSCIVGRGRDGTEVVFPVFENHHRDHILDVTVLPARIPAAVAEMVKDVARRAARQLDVVGLLTVEFFLSRTRPKTKASALVDGWYILINEFAPRPHNSGHITMKACDLSQFEILARILAGVPLHEPQLNGSKSYCMSNLLGDVWLSQNAQPVGRDLNLSALAEFPQVVDVVLYGKTEPRARRKMGHFILEGDSADELVKQADTFRAALRASHGEQRL